MTKEEAIRRIKEFGLYHAIGDLPHSAKTVEAFDIAIEALLAKTEWIPCSERLPEYRKTVLISTFWGVKTGYLDNTKIYGDFWEIIEEDGDTVLQNVYAWMPLPMPYREDDEE